MYYLYFWMLIGTNAAPVVTEFSSKVTCEEAGRVLQQAYAPNADANLPATDFSRFKCVKH